jgi:N-acetylglucosamine-6-phosphate deacetylase
MKTALLNGRIFTGDEWIEDQALIIEDKRILGFCAVNELPENLHQRIDLQGQRLLPGLVDTQVNGGGGVMFNDVPSVETLIQISQAHRKFGTTALLPTLISDKLSVVEHAITAVRDALDQGVPGIIGIHLEGPFLNPARKGVHNDKKFRRLDDQAIELLTSLPHGKTLVTLAPELTTPERIRQLCDAGVIVAAGHTAADYTQTRQALDAGVKAFTHLFNAMTPFSSREPGVVGAALEDSESWCGVIVDGFHVHPASLRVALAAKPRGKMLLVTDAMATLGSELGGFYLNGEWIQAVDGRCATSAGTLAGSALDMLSAVRNTRDWLKISLDEALRMASRYPAEMLGLGDELGSLKSGYRASMILVDEELRLINSWIDGKALH